LPRSTQRCPAAYQGLAAELVGGTDDEASELHAGRVRMVEIGERLAGQPRAAGAIRSKVRGQDVFALRTPSPGCGGTARRSRLTGLWTSR
jgi:hypothetical protein